MTLVVVGDLVTDVVAALAQPLVIGSDAAAAVRISGGGSGANVAAWLGAGGADVAFVGCVGDDSAAAARAAELGAMGVRTHLAVDPARPTGTVVVLVTPDGERTMLPDRGANLGLAPQHLPVAVFAAGGHLHLSGYTLFDEGPRAAGVEALRLARAAGMPVSVDPSSAQPLRDAGPRQFLAWTAGADLCLPNAAEACVLAGTDDVVAAAHILSDSYREVVVKLGPDGALWCDGSRVVRRPASPVAVTDTTGAGDAFAAGLLLARSSGAAVVEQVDAGNALAAVAVTLHGARPPQRGVTTPPTGG